MIKKIIKENYYYIFVILFLLIILSIIMNLSVLDSIATFDYKFISFINEYSSDKLSLLFKFVTNFGDFYIEAASYMFSGIITYIAKLLASRPRPLEALIEIPSSFSFPSGHTLTSIVFYGLLFYLVSIHSSKTTKIVGFILSLIIISIVAISRIYLGVHYFTDVVGGFILGIPCLMMIINIIEKNFKEKL